MSPDSYIFPYIDKYLKSLTWDICSLWSAVIFWCLITYLLFFFSQGKSFLYILASLLPLQSSSSELFERLSPRLQSLVKIPKLKKTSNIKRNKKANEKAVHWTGKYFCNMYIQEILKYKELLQVSNKVKQPVKNGWSLNWHYKDVQMTNMQKTRCCVLFVFGERDFKPTTG